MLYYFYILYYLIKFPNSIFLKTNKYYSFFKIYLKIYHLLYIYINIYLYCILYLSDISHIEC